jgi:hypothetical protein
VRILLFPDSSGNQDSSGFFVTSGVQLVQSRQPVPLRENIEAQAASTDGRATLYAKDQTHMFGRKGVIKKQRGGFKQKKQNHLFFLFLPEAVFEHVYISTHYRHVVFSSQIKSKVGNILVKTVVIRINLNIDRVSITSTEITLTRQPSVCEVFRSLSFSF